MTEKSRESVTGEGNAPRVADTLQVACQIFGTIDCEVAKVINATLGWCVIETPKGFALFDGFGYSGTFKTEAEALTRFMNEDFH